jgi:hypothetical protein
MQFCAYIHARPNGEVFYVGKGTTTRARSLAKAARSKWHGRVVNKYGKENVLVGVMECSSEQTAFELEIGLIKCLRRMGARLVNQTDGGQGQAGRKPTPEENAKRVAKIKGVPRPLSVRQAISAAHKGKSVSDSTKAKLSQIFKARPLHPNFLARQKGRVGAANPHAKKVVAVDTNGNELMFDTLTAAASYIGGDVGKISRAIKRNFFHLGWKFKYYRQEQP